MKFARVAVLVFLAGEVGVAQSQPITLKAGIEFPEIEQGAAKFLVILLKETNNSLSDVDCLGMSYNTFPNPNVLLQDESGKKIPQIHEELLHIPLDAIAGDGAARPCIPIHPGETKELPPIAMDRLYSFDRAGRYTVTVKHQYDPGDSHSTITSNPVTITVVPTGTFTTVPPNYPPVN